MVMMMGGRRKCMRLKTRVKWGNDFVVRQEEGDELYKSAKFEEAIKKYTATLDRITDKSSELALKVYANR